MELGDQLISCLLLPPKLIRGTIISLRWDCSHRNLASRPHSNAIPTRAYETKALLAIDTCSQLSAAKPRRYWPSIRVANCLQLQSPDLRQTKSWLWLRQQPLPYPPVKCHIDHLHYRQFSSKSMSVSVYKSSLKSELSLPIH
jgi:hypothetical protein